MAIRTEASHSGKERYYVNVRYRKPNKDHPQPLGLSFYTKKDDQGNLLPEGRHVPIRGGIDGYISKVAVYAKEILGEPVEEAHITLSDDSDYDTVLVFNTGGPDGYSYSAGSLVARLLAATVGEKVEIKGHVFDVGTEKRRPDGSTVKREEPEVFVTVSQNGVSLKPYWGDNEDGTPREKGPQAPEVLNSAGKKVGVDFSAECRPFMVHALEYLKEAYNNRAQQTEAQEAGIDADALAQDLGEDEDQQMRERQGA